MFRWIVAACLAVLATGGVWLMQRGFADAAEADASAKPRIVINLTSGLSDLHRSTMALSLAKHSLDDGREVIVFLNVRGPELAKKTATAQGFGDNPPPQRMLADLMSQGAQVHVCPSCMKAVSMEQDDLLPGSLVTDREKLFGKLSAGTIVFSY